MKIFIDSAVREEIEHAAKLGFVSGVTTNPSLLTKAGGGSLIDTVKWIAQLDFEHISVEPNTNDIEKFIKQAIELSQIDERVVIKVPINANGFETMERLNATSIRFMAREERWQLEKDDKRLHKWKVSNLKINATLGFTPEQALLVAQSKADYFSVFFGRIEEGMVSPLLPIPDTIEEALIQNYEKIDSLEAFHKRLQRIAQICKAKDIQSIADSIHSIDHFNRAAACGYDIATVPYKVLMEIVNNQQTADGVQNFLASSAINAN